MMCHMPSESLVEVARSFFTDVESDNTREHWREVKSVYDDVIRPGFLDLVEPASGFGAWRVYRAANDTRFGNAKGPYKTFIGAVAERPDGVGAFVKLDSRGLLVGTGLPQPAPDQLPRLRDGIAGEAGGSFVAAVTSTRDAGADVHGGRWEPLKRVPRPYPPDHPRGEYLRWKGVEVNVRSGEPTDLGALLDRGAAVHWWLARHVGPSHMSAAERYAPKG